MAEPAAFIFKVIFPLSWPALFASS